MCSFVNPVHMVMYHGSLARRESQGIKSKVNAMVNRVCSKELSN